MSRLLVHGFLTAGCLALAFGWATTSYWPASLALLILTPLGLYLVKRKFTPTLGIFLALAVISAALGISLHMPLPYALTSLLCLLAAWDLDEFTRRLAFAAPEDTPASLQKQHLQQLSLLLLSGLGASLLTTNLHLKFNFELAIGLVLLIFASLLALLNWLRNLER